MLITKPDFTKPDSRRLLRSTLSDLLTMNIVPILNENDVVTNDSESKWVLQKNYIDIKGINVLSMIVPVFDEK